jgi:glutamate N-acetyltransferase/amino-acid N-acetyltransferase
VSITAASGFVAAGVSGGLKADGALDLALVATADGQPANAAGVFTSNRMTAAPVLLSQSHLRMSAGTATAVLLNSGNANAATGEHGMADAEELVGITAAELGTHPPQVLMCSTGLIGDRLPVATMTAAIPGLVAARSVDGADAAAEAILTTDTCAKQTVRRCEGVTVGGMAKGAAMLSPALATMLAVLTTDAEASPADLQAALRAGVEHSFNALTVDGCQSTNDTVLLLASGGAGPASHEALCEAVSLACGDLAEQMARDAEGATKFVRVHVTGAASDGDAQKAARKIADSLLVKCSWAGEDPYWGRIASEAGSAGIHFDQELVSVSYGEVMVARHGVSHAHDEAAVRRHMTGGDLEITVDLGLGAGRYTVMTNDLTHGYVDENMGTS